MKAVCECEIKGTWESANEIMELTKKLDRSRGVFDAAQRLTIAAEENRNRHTEVYVVAAAEMASIHAQSDKYLALAAKLALETLQELGSPGCKWLEGEKG